MRMNEAVQNAIQSAETFHFDPIRLLYTGGILLAAILLGLAVQRLVARQLHRMATRTATGWDNVLVDSLKGSVVLWFFLIGLVAILKFVPVRPEILALLRRTIGVLGIFAAVLFFSKLARGVIHNYIDRIVDVPTALFKNSATVIIYLLGFLVALDYVGVSITPLVTALGVSGVGFALALQDTLANLFAGLSILMSRKVRPGEFIRLDSGEEGIVCDITWRNTTIRNSENNLIVVPNGKLASAIVTNMHQPEKEAGLFLPVTVAFDNDLAAVEKVTLEVAREAMSVPGRPIEGFEPAIRYNAFTDAGVRFSVILRIKEFQEMYALRHEFYKRLHERYRQAGIKLAVPPRAVTIEKPQ
jgi:small-conductance mechanosensitive channel